MLDELYTIDKTKLVGLVLDMSTRFVGRLRLVDEVKNVLTNVFTSMKVGDRVYICTDADCDDRPRQLGEGISKMADFEVPFDFGFNVIANHTISMIGTDEDADQKYMLIVTDRYTPMKAAGYDRIFWEDTKNKYGCKFCIISMGGRYGSELVSRINNEDRQNVTVHRLASIDGFEEIVREFIFGGIDGKVHKEAATEEADHDFSAGDGAEGEESLQDQT